MNSITKKHLPRRMFLRGMGVTLSLPLLDSMVPAQTPLAKTAANAKTPLLRHLCAARGHDGQMDSARPKARASSSPKRLKPLEKLRDRVNVVSNLAHPAAGGVGSDAGGDHARSAAVFLSGAHPEKGSMHAWLHARSGAGRAHRPGHAAAFDRTVD